MSEYLFRGLRTVLEQGSEWIYGYGAIDDEILTLDFTKGIVRVECDKGTVGQYINLKDTKTGVKIFEGDKVRCYGGEHYDGYWEYNTIIIIDDLANDCFMMGEHEFLEIIGNIYE